MTCEQWIKEAYLNGFLDGGIIGAAVVLILHYSREWWKTWQR